MRKGETGNAFYMKNAVYNAAGALASATLGLDGANQWTETRAYNSRLQARRVEVAKGGNTLLRLRWAYGGAYNDTTFEETGTDNNGDLRVERLEHLHQGALQTVDRTYAYTGADRLSYFTETGGKYQYFGYDAFGNAWQTYVSQVPALRQTGASWYLKDGVVNNRLANTIYDAAGNQTQLSASPGTVASYDGANRMSKIVGGGSEVASYTYDAEGRRVAKTVSGTTTYYFYDAAGQLMAEYGGPAQTAGTQYFTTDSLGSTRMILGATGNCLERLDYAPFGGQIARSGMDCYGGSSSEKPLFTGQMRDGESAAGTDTGQDYFNARYLWANIARFTSPDAPFADQRPEDGQSWNLYAYARNNPLLYVDPMGNYVCASSVTTEQCDSFQQSLDQGQTAANALKDKYGADSKQYTDAQAAISSFGERGKNNGVTIAIGDTGKSGAVTKVANTAGPVTAENVNGQKITVTFNAATIGNTALAAHEGSHVADASAYVSSGFNQSLNPTNRQTETKAFQLQSNIGIGLGWAYQTVTFGGHAPYLLNVRGWPQANTNSMINTILKQQYRNLELRAFPAPAPRRRR